REFPLSDDVNCETLQITRFANAGYARRLYEPERRVCLGAHREDVSDPLYTFERFRRLGAKIVARNNYGDLEYRLFQLAISQHRDIAVLATVAMLAGLGIELHHDDLRPATASLEYDAWTSLSSTSSTSSTALEIGLDAGTNFERFSKGVACAKAT